MVCKTVTSTPILFTVIPMQYDGLFHDVYVIVPVPAAGGKHCHSFEERAQDYEDDSESRLPRMLRESERS